MSKDKKKSITPKSSAKNNIKSKPSNSKKQNNKAVAKPTAKPKGKPTVKPKSSAKNNAKSKPSNNKKPSNKAVAKPTSKSKSEPTTAIQSRESTNIGKVFFGETKYIRKEPKKSRRYLVTNDNGEDVKVSRLISIKKTNEKGENANPRLVEIKPTYKGLTMRTGVENEVYSNKLGSSEKLKLGKVNKIFDEKEEFRLDDEDMEKVRSHIKKNRIKRRWMNRDNKK